MFQCAILAFTVFQLPVPINNARRSSEPIPQTHSLGQVKQKEDNTEEYKKQQQTFGDHFLSSNLTDHHVMRLNTFTLPH